MRNVVISLIIGIPLVLNGQNFKSYQFEERVRFAGKLLTMSPESNTRIDEFLPPDFQLVGKEEFKFYFKDAQGNSITAYLHVKTSKIAYVEFTEPNSTFAEVQKFLTDEKKFEWLGAQHLWNYFNDKRISLAISPEMVVHVSLYDL